MEIKQFVKSPRGAILADVGKGLYIGKLNTMELAVCTRTDEGFKVEKTVLAGYMMREDKDFTSAVENLKEEEILIP